MKTRLQVRIEPEDYEALRSWARWRGVSMSGAVRWLIRDRLASQEQVADPQVQRFLAAAGAIRGGPNEAKVSAEHDRYLYGLPEA